MALFFFILRIMLKEFYHCKSRHETADMCIPGDTGLTGKENTVIDLDYEPERQYDQRGNMDDPDDEEKEKKQRNPVPREFKQICAEHSGDGATGSDHGNVRVGKTGKLTNGSGNPDDQIEYQITRMTDQVFNVIAKNPQVKHISGKMHEAGMQKHGRENVQVGRRIALILRKIRLH